MKRITQNDNDAFEKICGNCADVDMSEITEEDVRKQAEYYNVDEEWIQAALRGLANYQ